MPHLVHLGHCALQDKFKEGNRLIYMKFIYQFWNPCINFDKSFFALWLRLPLSGASRTLCSTGQIQRQSANLLNFRKGQTRPRITSKINTDRFTKHLHWVSRHPGVQVLQKLRKLDSKETINIFLLYERGRDCGGGGKVKRKFDFLIWILVELSVN